MLSAIERDSEQWNGVWGMLHTALQATPLPTEQGNTVMCDRGDFMLIGIDEHGTTHFKNIITRNYLQIDAAGALRIPTGGTFALGFFAHQTDEG